MKASANTFTGLVPGGARRGGVEGTRLSMSRSWSLSFSSCYGRVFGLEVARTPRISRDLLNVTGRRDMEVLIERMLGDFENGRLSRRQLAVHLVALATGAAAATKAD